MRGKIRQALAGVAIYAIALQAVLSAFVPPAGPAPGADFAAAICHSVVDGDSGGGGVPAQLPQSCDHCILCAAGPAASLPHSEALDLPHVTTVGPLLPSTAASISPAPVQSHFARGPPLAV